MPLASPLVTVLVVVLNNRVIGIVYDDTQQWLLLRLLGS